MRLALRLAIAAALGIAAVSHPSTADAQFGGLIKKKIGEKIAEKSGDKDKQPAQPGGAQFSDDQVDRYIKAQLAYYADVADYTAKNEARQQEQAAFQQKMGAYTACMQTGSAMSQAAMANAAPMMGAAITPDMQRFAMAMRDKIAGMTPAEADAFQKKVDDLARRGKEAQRTQNKPEMARISKEFEQLLGIPLPQYSAAERERLQANAAGGQQAAAMGQAAGAKIKSCGEAPQPPASVYQPLQRPAANAYMAKAGLAALDEGRIRENFIRYAQWLQTPDGQSGKAGDPILDKHRDDVVKVVTLWKQYENGGW